MKAPPDLEISLVVIASDRTLKPALFLDLMAACRSEVEALGRRYEVVIVDDGVNGAFAESAIALKQEWPAVRIIQFRRQFGESVALDAATQKARGKYVICMSWYLQVEVSGIRKAVEILDAGGDYVAGRRFPRVDGRLARFQSWLFNAYTRRLTDVQLHDLNCSFRAFRREVVDELSFHGDLFRFIGILATQNGFRVTELPLRHLREEGPAGLIHPGAYARRFLDILSLFFLIKFTHKPLRFFGLAGFGFLFAGFLICLWVLYLKFVVDESLTQRPIVVLGIFLVVLGFIVGSIGLIGEIIIFTQGRSFRDYHIDRIIDGDSPGESGAS